MKRLLGLLTIGGLLALGMLTANAQGRSATTLTVVTHDSFAVSEDVIEAFEEQTGISVRILRGGDAGTMVNQAVLSRQNPLGDVLYGVDNTFLTRALDADIFEPYESPFLEYVAEEFIVDDEFRVTPVDYGDVCLNYDVKYFAEADLAPPDSLEDLVDPAYRGLLVVESPLSSSPGLAFLLATIERFGSDENLSSYTFVEYWADLVRNDVLVVEDWVEAYYGEFSGSNEGGTHPLVVSYASSPPAEVFFAEEELDVAPTGTVVTDGTCFRQIEFVGILKGTEHLTAAQRFVDFMLDVEFQEDLPLQMFVFPVNEHADLPDVFVQHAAIPENPAFLDIETIAANREAWVRLWTETVLR
jgi:thiamine transport system substrate-binding protein